MPLESVSSGANPIFKVKSTESELGDNIFSKQSKNYILNKFLQTDAPPRENNEERKPPVPKPRKKIPVLTEIQRQSSAESQRTFEITSPKILKNINSPESSSSKKTYKVEEIVDVLVHESPSVKKKDKEISSDISSHSRFKRDGEDVATDDKTAEIIEMKQLNKEQREEEEGTAEEHSVDEPNDSKMYSYEKIVEIVIHKTDRLQLSSLVVHPVVKIHVVDITTGKYFPKSDKSRCVVFFYEDNDCQCISPVMTHAYNLQEKRILFPSWEETVLLNEDSEYFKNESHRIMIFFEVLDFVPFSSMNQPNHTTGWHYIAFAFLKFSGKGGVLNFDKKMRLQMYYPHHQQDKKSKPHECGPWKWWKKKKLEKYPSSLYVTIKSVLSPTTVIETFRSKTPNQRESSCKRQCFHKKENVEATLLREKNENVETTSWSKPSHEICKLPNNCLAQFDSGDEGCFVMKFSCSGLYLACAVQNGDLYCIVIYSVSSLTKQTKIPSHQGFIYDIKWSKDDLLLLSSSADNTISVFSLLSQSFLQILPHPSYVYCCDINNDETIISGCYDGMVRIWNRIQENNKNAQFHLFQELEGHRGYVTCLTFFDTKILSADSVGLIIEWQREKTDWIAKREIHILDLKETVINQIILFPKGKRILVYSKDNVLRIIDARSGCILQWLRGATNKRGQTFCAISPCGTYVYSGSENGFLHIWSSKTGEEVGRCVPYSLNDRHFLTVNCIDHHPFDNILAISHYGKNFPILLYCFDKSTKQPEIDIIIKEGGNSESCTTNIKLGNAARLQRAASGKPDFKKVLHKMDAVVKSTNR